MGDVLDGLVTEGLSRLAVGDIAWNGFEPPLRAGLTVHQKELPEIPPGALRVTRRFQRIYSDLMAAVYTVDSEDKRRLHVLAATNDDRTLRYFYPYQAFEPRRGREKAEQQVIADDDAESLSVGRPAAASMFTVAEEQFAWQVAAFGTMYFIEGLMPSQRRGFNWLYGDDGFDVIPGIATTVTSASWRELLKSDPDFRIFTSFARDAYRLEVPLDQQSPTMKVAIYQAPEDAADAASYYYGGPGDTPLPLLFSRTLPTL